MPDRSLFDVRYAFPGYSFLIFTTFLSFGEIIVRVQMENLRSFASFFGFIYLLSGAPIGYFTSQIWYFYFYHIKKGFFYQDRLRKKERSFIKYLLTEKTEEIEFVSDNPDNLNIMLDYMINLSGKKSEFYSYITRRWDLFHVMGATEISILLGIVFGLFLKIYCAYNVYLPITYLFKVNISSILIDLFGILLLRDGIIIIIGIIFMIIFHLSKVRIAYERDTMLNILIRNIDKTELKKHKSKLGTIHDDFFKNVNDITKPLAAHMTVNPLSLPARTLSRSRRVMNKNKGNESYPNAKKDLEHQLFFGLVFSLALLVISYPELSEISELFGKFIDPKVAISVTRFSRGILISCLGLSSIYRYYGAVKESIRHTLRSLFWLLIGFHLTINIIIYKVFWIWLSSIYFPVTMILPLALLLINIYGINKYEKKWYMYYSDKIPKVIASDFSILFNGWILTSLLLSVLALYFITLTQTVIYIILGLSAILSPKIVLHFRTKYPYTQPEKNEDRNVKLDEGRSTPLSKERTQLEKIKGIAEKRATLLRENEIANIPDFLKTDESILKELLGLSEETIQRMKTECENLLESQS